MKRGSLFFSRLGLGRPELKAWALYDWANSAFATTILAAVFPIFYSRVAGADLPPHLATSYWGYTVAGALLLIAGVGPLLGAAADYLGAKKRFLACFTALGLLFTAGLFFVERGDWLLASLLFFFAHFGFAGSLIFYDALLPHIAETDEVDRVSTAGYALGYVGGGLLLLLNILWIQKPELFGIPDRSTATRLAFLSVSIWWALFSLPLFFKIPEPPRHLGEGESADAHPLSAAYRRLGLTFREISKYRELFKFLIAFWLYNDGIGTIIKMAAIFGAETGIGTQDLLGALLLVQFVGVPFTFLFGLVAHRIGTKRGIQLALAVYAVISLFGFFLRHAWQFWVLALLVGIVQGGSQALSRSLYSCLIPKAKSAEFFSFFSISEKISGVLGPLLFAVVGQVTGSSRFSILSLLVFFGVGMFLLNRVDLEKGRAAALAENGKNTRFRTE